jgi:hypothetical protein
MCAQHLARVIALQTTTPLYVVARIAIGKKHLVATLQGVIVN